MELKDQFRSIERALQKQLCNSTACPEEPTPVFILSAPRSGSTLLYQALCHRLALPYISNLTNDFFATSPVVGLAIQKAMPVQIRFDSQYGKTDGFFQPSEASAVMRRWFGGGHPSALVSARILAGMEASFIATLKAAEILFGAPLVIKNAWHCFRLPYLAAVLPGARFLWLRRNIRDAAKSDLAARYKTKGSADIWNSATPANVEELKKLPPTAQVVENQYEFNRAIGRSLSQHAEGRWIEFSYDDFLDQPERTFVRVGRFLGRSPLLDSSPVTIVKPSGKNLSTEDKKNIDAYVTHHAHRLESYDLVV